MPTAQGAEPAAKQFSLTRTFDAPLALVWQVLSQSEHLAHWWGPKGMVLRVHALDVSPGGLFHYSMVLPNGDVWWGKWVYREIEAPHRLSFVSSFSDAEAGVGSHPMAPTFPRQVLNVWELSEKDGKTTLHMSGAPVTPTEDEQRTFDGAMDGMEKGFGGTFAMLDEYLAAVKAGEGKEVGDREYLLTRVIDAPRDRIFDAWADRERIARWWGPRGFHSTIETFELRPGGSWKFVMHGPDGKDFPNDNSFVEVVRPSRIVVRHGSDPKFQITATFEDIGGGKTRVTWRGLFDSAETLVAVKGYALPGALENLEKLAEEVARDVAG